jgi:hypothetical protein
MSLWLLGCLGYPVNAAALHTSPLTAACSRCSRPSAHSSCALPLAPHPARETFFLLLSHFVPVWTAGGAGLVLRLVSQPAVPHTGHFDGNLHAAEKGGGDALTVASDHARPARALLHRAALVAAGAGCMTLTSMKWAGKVTVSWLMAPPLSSSTCRITCKTWRPDSGSSSRKSTRWGHRDLARTPPVAASYQSGVADGVVRDTERALGDQRSVRRQQCDHRLEL